MKKYQKIYAEELDFSRDSRIEESLLHRIKEERFCALEDDALGFLNAAGTIDEMTGITDEDKKKRETGDR